MYETHFGLQRKPFQSALSQAEYFPSEGFNELAPVVLHALQSDQGVAVLSGPSGSGKTAALDAIRRSLENSCRAVVIRGGAARTSADLLQSLHRLLRKTDSDEEVADCTMVQRWQVVERLQRVTEFWGPLVVLLDDAHLLDEAVFSELRSLLEEDVAGQKLVRLMITGPLALEEVLAQPSLGDFAQKIRTHVFLEPLRTAESVEYLKHHLKCAGGDAAELFDGAAVECIVAAADGMPRCLNLLADEALMIGAEKGMATVTAEVVNAALGRLQHLPVAWNAVPVSESEEDLDADFDSDFEVGSANQPTGGVVETNSSSSSGVIEIGGPQAPRASAAEVSDGVVEIGAPVASNGVVEIGASVASDGAVEIGAPVASDGAIEIGGDGPGTVTQSDFAAAAVSSTNVAVETMEAAVAESEFSADDTVIVHDGVIEFGAPEEPEEFDRQEVLITPSVETEEIVFVTGQGSAPPALETLSTFEDGDRWAPSGTWPPSAEIDHSLSGDTIPIEDDCLVLSDSVSEARLEDTSDPLLVDTIMEFAAEAIDLVETATPTEPGGIVEVVDRYTWQEQNRPVPGDISTAQTLVPETEHIVWPPTTTGVAPKDSIAVLPGPLFELQPSRELEASFPLVPEMSADPTSEPFGTFDDTIPLRDSVEDLTSSVLPPDLRGADLDRTIDEIQEVLHSEIFELSALDDSSDDLSDVEEDADPSTVWVSGQPVDEDDGWPELFVLPVSPEDDTQSEFDSIESLLERTGVHDESLDAYEPRLLQEARDTLSELPVVLDASGTGVRLSSETERVPEDVTYLTGGSSVAPSLPPSSVGRPAAESDLDSPQEAGGRFRDLFTRLRSMQNRSA